MGKKFDARLSTQSEGLKDVGVSEEHLEKLRDLCRSMGFDDVEDWWQVRECTYRLARHQKEFSGIPGDIQKWLDVAEAAEVLLTAMKTETVQRHLGHFLTLQHLFPWETAARAVEERPDYSGQSLLIAKLKEMARKKRPLNEVEISLDDITGAATKAVDSIAQTAHARAAYLKANSPVVPGRRQSLEHRAEIIASLAFMVKRHGIAPGEGGPFMRLCDLMFEVAGIPAKSSGAIKKFNKKMRPVMKERGQCL